MAEEDEGNYIDIEEDEEEENQVSNLTKNNQNNFYNQGEGVQFDINKAMEDCKGIEKIEARNDTGKVNNYLINILLFIQRQKFDSATYEKNKQEKEKKEKK